MTDDTTTDTNNTNAPAWNVFAALDRANPTVGKQVKVQGFRITVSTIFESMMHNPGIPNSGAAEVAWDLTLELHGISRAA